jgi:hypothetical protein
MCFVISIVFLALSYNFFIINNLVAAISSLSIALFFIYLMLKNILFVENLKSTKREDFDS